MTELKFGGTRANGEYPAIRRPPEDRDAAAAIAGTFADYCLIKSRGVLQLRIEIPVERQAEAFAALGYPVPGKDIHVAVARLAQPVSPPANQEGCTSVGDPRGTCIASQPAGEPKQRKPFHTLPAVQRAAMLCQDERFRAWIARYEGDEHWPSQEEAASWLRSEIGIDSRTRLSTNAEALAKFELIETAYMQDTGLMARAG